MGDESGGPRTRTVTEVAVRIYILVLLAQVVDTPDACRAAGDAVDAVKEAVSPTEDHRCGCDYYRATGTMWNVYACDSAGNKVGTIGARHFCCATCRRVCNR